MLHNWVFSGTESNNPPEKQYHLLTEADQVNMMPI